MKSILVIGSSNTDMVIKSPVLPAPGETVLGGAFLMNPGGKGANQAVAAARLGGKVSFLAKVGADVFGEQAIRGFEKEGIDTEYVLTDEDAPSGVALILVDGKGENLISVASGANGRLSPKDVSTHREAIEQAEILLLQLETPLDTVASAISAGHEAGKLIILNPAPAAELSADLLAKVDILTPNEHEAAMLTGIPVTDVSSAQSAATALQQMGVKTVIITMGSQGVLLQTESDRIMIPAPTVEVVDTTAAGDTFNGALAASLASGNDLEEAAKLAVKAASISVTRMGAQASCPTLSDLSS